MYLARSALYFNKYIIYLLLVYYQLNHNKTQQHIILKNIFKIIYYLTLKKFIKIWKNPKLSYSKPTEILQLIIFQMRELQFSKFFW